MFSVQRHRLTNRTYIVVVNELTNRKWSLVSRVDVRGRLPANAAHMSMMRRQGGYSGPDVSNPSIVAVVRLDVAVRPEVLRLYVGSHSIVAVV